MAKELKTQFPSDETLYAVVLNAAAQAWRTDTSVFENLSASNWGDYAVAMAEQSTTGIYLGNFPTGITAAGDYPILFRQQSGGSPAASDSSGGMTGGVLHWSGTAEIVYTNPPSAAAIAAAIGSPVNVTFVSPVTQSGSADITRGDDYFNVDGRALTWTNSAGAWPNLAGGSVQMKVQIVPGNSNVGTTGFELAGVISASGTAAQSVYVELPSATTSGLALGNGSYYFSVVATLANGHIVTIVEGTISVAHEP